MKYAKPTLVTFDVESLKARRLEELPFGTWFMLAPPEINQVLLLKTTYWDDGKKGFLCIHFESKYAPSQTNVEIDRMVYPVEVAIRIVGDLS